MGGVCARSHFSAVDRSCRLRVLAVSRAGEKPFKCDHCEYRSYKKSCVKKHSMTHSEDKPYQCQYCDHKARFKADLEKHERTHTGERPFECEFCEYRAAVKSSVTQHMVRCHKDMVP